MGKIKGFLFAVRHREILMIWVYLQHAYTTSFADMQQKIIYAVLIGFAFLNKASANFALVRNASILPSNFTFGQHAVLYIPFLKTLFSCVSRNATRLDRLLPAGALAHFAKSILVHSHRGISRQKNTRMAYRQSMTFTALPLSIAFTMSWATLLASSCKG